MVPLLNTTLGRNGLISAAEKCEGDGCTPMGVYPLREIWYRADRVAKPETALPVREIMREDCWCDDAAHPLYNRHFRLPLSPAPQSFEHLWREDAAYDVIVVIGFNDAPVVSERGSAIFMHCEHDDGRPTAGCVALPKKELLELIKILTPNSTISIGEKIIVA